MELGQTLKNKIKTNYEAQFSSNQFLKELKKII
jgi:hypothetical protein